MSDELSWRDLAGFWGAGLSTFLAVSSIKLPVFHIEPGEAPISDLTLRIANPRGKMIFVREWFRLPIGSKAGWPLGIFTDDSKFTEIGEPGKLWISIKAGDEKLVKINCLSSREQQAAWLLIFLWHGAGLLPCRWPAVVYISAKRATRINAAK